MSEDLEVVTRWLYACVGVLVLLVLVGILMCCRRYRPWRRTRLRPVRRLESTVEQRKSVSSEGTGRKTVVSEDAAVEPDNLYEWAP